MPLSGPFHFIGIGGTGLTDRLFRERSGSLNIDVPAVVSNHRDLGPLVASYGIPFHHVPVTADTKVEAEARLRQIVSEHEVDLVHGAWVVAELTRV